VGFTFVQEGRAQCVILAGIEDTFAARKLAAAVQFRTGVAIPIVAARDWRRKEALGAVLVGSVGSNPAVRDLAARCGLALSPAELTEDGYLLRTMPEEGNMLLLTGEGSSGLHSAVSSAQSPLLP